MKFTKLIDPNSIKNKLIKSGMDENHADLISIYLDGLSKNVNENEYRIENEIFKTLEKISRDFEYKINRQVIYQKSNGVLFKKIDSKLRKLHIILYSTVVVNIIILAFAITYRNQNHFKCNIGTY